MEKKYLLGLDIGGSGFRAGIFNLKGQLVSSHTSSFSVHFMPDGTSHYDIGEMQEAAKQGIRKTVEESGIAAEEIAAICSSVNGGMLIGYDEKGHAVTPAYYYTDKRYFSRMPEMYEDLQKAGISKAEQMARTAGLARLPSMIRTLRKEEPETVAKVDKWGFSVQPFIYEVLGAECTTESEDFAFSYGFWDPVKHAPIQEMSDAMQVSADDFMPIKYGGSPCGTVSAEGAERTGLAEGIPVYTGVNDQLCQLLAHGSIHEDSLLLGMGSVLVVSKRMKNREVEYDPMFYIGSGGTPDTMRLAPSLNPFGLGLAWVMDKVAFGFLGKEAEKLTGEDRYTYMFRKAAEAPIGSNGIIIAPYPNGVTANKAAKMVVTGITQGTSTADICRAMIEALCFETRKGLDIVHHNANTSSNVIYITGKPATSDVWMQIMADICGVPLQKISDDSSLAAVKGAAMLAGVSAGIYNSYEEAVATCVTLGEKIEPIPENVERYKDYFEAYKEMTGKCLAMY